MDKKQLGNAAKKSMLKKMVRGNDLNKDGSSPFKFKLDSGLGKTPLTRNEIMSGNGSNISNKKAC